MSFHRCLRCGQHVGDNQVHYCPSVDTPLGPSSPPFNVPWPTPVQPLTEDDVRRIIREELAAYNKPAPADPCDSEAIGGEDEIPQHVKECTDPTCFYCNGFERGRGE